MLVALGAEASAKAAQTAKPPASTTKKPAPKPPATRKPGGGQSPPVTEPAMVNCPMTLGDGARTADVLRRPHRPGPGWRDRHYVSAASGAVTLTFNLHNRHTYSEEQIKTNRAYHRYTATIGVLALDNTLFSRP